MSRTAKVLKIALPSAVPDIVSGLRLSLTVSLILTGVGEMLASRDGIGQWILFAARSFRSADLYAGVALFGLIGYVGSQALNVAEQWALRWRPAASSPEVWR